MDLTKELERAERAARAAGEQLRKHAASDQTILSQEGRDVKLQADQDAEAVILEILRESPFAILAEESGEHGEIASDLPLWVVDPLDGTYNYSRQIPFCAVSIALCRGEEPLLGVIYDFNRDEMFCGIVGQGATLNGTPIRVSEVRDRSQAVLVTGVPARSVFTPEVLMQFAQRMAVFKKVRLMGSAAVMLAYVCCGRADAYLENEIMFWDVAAGIALIRAAGGWVHIEPSEHIAWGRRVRCAADGSLWEGI
ncbi:MAG: inositol monophosphatase [Candidatus Hydrogenedens sp.]|nr:inositol monophosphatase [Candidatus Hydrogenedens sp.]